MLTNSRKRIPVFAGIIIAFILVPVTLKAQDVPISFDRYHSYNGTSEYLKKVNKAYPGITELMTIGESTMGRPIYLLVISNMSKGTTIDRHIDLRNERKENIENVPPMKIHQGKPGHFISGSTHGNEYTGTEVCLYMIDKLVSSYGNDETITGLVDNRAFYICPVINPDGVYNSVEKGIRQRNNSMEKDDDEDGRINEDGVDDIDGDGFITSFRYEDDEGRYVIDDVDPRLMVRLGRDEETDKQRYSVIREALDNDKDGKIGEDPESGIDLNRNFPEGWNLDAGNPYPMSEPETRNVFEFQLDHPNIFVSFHYHNTGRLIMFQAPPPVQLSSSQTEELRERTEERLEEMRKTDKYAQLFARRVSDEYQHDMDVQTKIVSEGAYILKNYRPVIGGLSGQAHAATYYMLGAYSYLIELWGSPVTIADTDNDGKLSDEEYMKWIDLDLAGDGWIDPHKVKHPDLGDVWIGGSAKKHMQRTPPSRYIEMEAEKNARFVMYCASQFPEVKIDDISIKAISNKIYQVDVRVENESEYPTASDRAVQLKRHTPDILMYEGSDNITLVETSGKDLDDGSRRRRYSYLRRSAPETETQLSAGEKTEFRLKGKEKKVIRYFIAMEGRKGTVDFTLESKTGGSDKESISIVVE